MFPAKFLACLAPVIALSSAAYCQQASPEPPAAWTTRCISSGRAVDADCSMEVRLSLQQTGQLFATVGVTVPAGTREPEFVIATPLGLYLPAGIALAVDGAALLSVPFQRCDGDGCYGRGALSETELAALENGQILQVALESQSGESLAFDVPLPGFGEALGQIR